MSDTIDTTEQIIEDDPIAVRRAKREALMAAGKDPYGHAFAYSHHLADLAEQYADLEDGASTEDEVKVAGRVMAKRDQGKLAFLELRDSTGDMQLFCRINALGEDAFAPYAWVLGSVHYLDGWAFDDPSIIEQWPEHGSVDDVWRRYFEVWCEAASSDMPFDAMSHPDLVKKFGFLPSFDPAPLYRRAAEAVRAAGRMIEVNTSGAWCPCEEMYPAPAFLREFCRAGVECSVGSDAHAPENVVRGIEDAYRLMREAGYRFVTVPTADGDRRRIPLE